MADADAALERIRNDPRAFEVVVDKVLESLPEWVHDQVDNVSVVTAEWPTQEQDPEGHGILGIYEGVSLLERGNDYYGTAPDRITIFRQPHLAATTTLAELQQEIRTTVLHELAHHLGIDDRRLHDLGWD